MTLTLLLELLPIIGPIQSILGMTTEVVAEPSAVGAMGGLATTIAVFNWLRPRINKLVEWTDTPRDNQVWNWITNIMGLVIKLARLEKKNLQS